MPTMSDNHVGQGLLQSALDVRPCGLGGNLLLLDAQYSRGAEDGLDADLAGGLEFLLQFAHCLEVGFRKRDIERLLLRDTGCGVKCDGHIQPAARDLGVDEIADAGLKLGEFAWEIDRDIALLAVHRIQLDGEFCTIVGALAPTVTGHASHDSRLKSVREITNTNSNESNTVILTNIRQPGRRPCHHDRKDLR